VNPANRKQPARHPTGKVCDFEVVSCMFCDHLHDAAARAYDDELL